MLQTSAAFTSAQDRAAALDGGADSYLVEPIEPDELVATVKALLRMRKAEQELRLLNETLEARVAERTRELAEANHRPGRRAAPTARRPRQRCGTPKSSRRSVSSPAASRMISTIC